MNYGNKHVGPYSSLPSRPVVHTPLSLPYSSQPITLT